MPNKNTLRRVVLIKCLGEVLDTEAGMTLHGTSVLAVPLVIYWRLAWPWYPPRFARATLKSQFHRKQHLLLL